MKKKNQYLVIIFIVPILSVISNIASAQKWYTKSGRISFHSKASLEEIDAVNKSVSAILDTKSGTLQFSVLMRGFEFAKALMQEHFNENYLESHKFPKAVFTGMVYNNSGITYLHEGTYSATVKGNLTIHGVTHPVEVSGNITLSNGSVQLKARFPVMLSEYKVSIPSIVADKISNAIEVKVDCNLNNKTE